METTLKLTNRDISQNYRDVKLWLMPSDFLGAFAYWVTALTNNDTYKVDAALNAFKDHVNSFFDNVLMPQQFTYKQTQEVVNEEVFKNIPEIMQLNKMKPDFIDLSALERNVFYMVLRQEIAEQCK